jgi:hypothetical protein
LFSELPETSSRLVKVMGNHGPYTSGENDTFSTALGRGSDVQNGVLIEANETKTSEYESKILQEQIDVPAVKVTYMTLYRYATIVDMAIIATSAA